MNSYKITTLNDFIILRQKDFPYAKGELSSLLAHIVTAAKIVNKKINKAGLVEITGRSGTVNIQGEDQQKLDFFADHVFTDALRSSGECCGIATEENQNEIIFTEKLARKGKYIVCMDPLDGSSNIDFNVSVGSIFSIYRRLTSRGEKVTNEDFLQGGNNQVAFIAEQAGGSASDGKVRILDKIPGVLHQRSPFYAGSRNMVGKIEELLENNT